MDVIIEIVNYTQRQQLEEKLRKIGFTNDVESGIVCRFKIQGIIVDIMPTDDPSIGFSNKWYPAGFEHAVTYHFEEGEPARILTAPYFIATKLEAFKSRGKMMAGVVMILKISCSYWKTENRSGKNLKIVTRQ